MMEGVTFSPGLSSPLPVSTLNPVRYTEETANRITAAPRMSGESLTSLLLSTFCSMDGFSASIFIRSLHPVQELPVPEDVRVQPLPVDCQSSVEAVAGSGGCVA